MAGATAQMWAGWRGLGNPLKVGWPWVSCLNATASRNSIDESFERRSFENDDQLENCIVDGYRIVLKLLRQSVPFAWERGRRRG